MGKPFPLAFIWGDLSARMDFLGENLWFGLDAGDYADGTLKSSLAASCSERAKIRQDSSVESKIRSVGTAVLFSAICSWHSNLHESANP
ncbi:MAG: hypothetical protein WDN00_09520 [Limisphaerales bacterium]